MDSRTHPTRRLLLHVLRHEATTLPRARDGSVSVEAVLTLLPYPFKESPMLVETLRPEFETEKPTFLMLCDWQEAKTVAMGA